MRTFELFLFGIFKDLGHHMERERRLDFILSRKGRSGAAKHLSHAVPDDGPTSSGRSSPIISSRIIRA